MKFGYYPCFFIDERENFMKIVDFESYKRSVNKLDAMASDAAPKLNTVFEDEMVADKMKKFFDVADGNSIWNND